MYVERQVLKSSVNEVPYEAAWLNRQSNPEDPWIDLQVVSNRGPGEF